MIIDDERNLKIDRIDGKIIILCAHNYKFMI